MNPDRLRYHNNNNNNNNNNQLLNLISLIIDATLGRFVFIAVVVCDRYDVDTRRYSVSTIDLSISGVFGGDNGLTD